MHFKGFWNILFCLFGICFSSNSLAFKISGECIPRNNFKISIMNKQQSGISKEEFELMLTKVEAAYAPIFADLGAKLKINRRWDDDLVDASAMRFNSTWVVNMYGGTARHPSSTVDGMTLIACHEIGHHVGGFPRDGLLSVEGQSDYYGALKCLRKVWANDDNISVVNNLNAPISVTQKCSNQFKTRSDVALCIRGAMAGRSMARFLAAIRGESSPNFETPSNTVVAKIETGHFHSQCRLDTLYAGSLCNIDQSVNVSEVDAYAGVCSQKQGLEIGMRPKCWFKEP